MRRINVNTIFIEIYNAYPAGSALPYTLFNIELNISTYCSVLDFTAEKNTCYLPQNMFELLSLQKGQAVNIEDVKLEKGK
jgi:hypothetical protein